MSLPPLRSSHPFLGPPRHFRALPGPEAVWGMLRFEGGDADSHPPSCAGISGTVAVAAPGVPSPAPSGATDAWCWAAQDSQRRGCVAVLRGPAAQHRLMSCLPALCTGLITSEMSRWLGLGPLFLLLVSTDLHG